MRRNISFSKITFTRVIVASLCMVVAVILYLTSIEPVEVNVITDGSGTTTGTKVSTVNGQTKPKYNRRIKALLGEPSYCKCGAAGYRQNVRLGEVKDGEYTQFTTSMKTYILTCYNVLGFKVKDLPCTKQCSVSNESQNKYICQ